MSQECLVEVPTCQLCGSAASDELFREPPFRVVRCAECRLVYVSPRRDLDALERLYGADYWASDSPKTRGYAGYVEDEPLYLKTFRRRLNLVAQHVPSGPLRVLDVGCAAGYFLRVMRDEGHDVRGIELSPDIGGYAVEHLGSESIHIGYIDDLDPNRSGFEFESFDLVTMWDVVEHVPDPQGLLRRARRFLKPKGVLILETQNVGSRFAGMLGRRWQHYKHEEHLYHFDPSTVERLLRETGFEPVHNTPSYGGKYVSLGFIAERAGRISSLVGALCKPLNLLKKVNFYVNLRDEMIVVAHPSDWAPS